MFTIVFREKILVVAGDMLDQENADRLGFKKREKYAKNYSVSPKWNWEIKLDNNNIANIVKDVIEILTSKHIQEVINRFQ